MFFISTNPIFLPFIFWFLYVLSPTFIFTSGNFYFGNLYISFKTFDILMTPISAILPCALVVCFFLTIVYHCSGKLWSLRKEGCYADLIWFTQRINCPSQLGKTCTVSFKIIFKHLTELATNQSVRPQQLYTRTHAREPAATWCYTHGCTQNIWGQMTLWEDQRQNKLIPTFARMRLSLRGRRQCPTSLKVPAQ